MTGQGQLLPAVEEIETLSRAIAFAVGRAAQQDNVAPVMSEEQLHAAIKNNFWQARYTPYRRASF